MNRNQIRPFIALAAILALVGPARAGTLTVTTTNDKRPGSPRNTITSAKNGDVILFAPSLNGQAITLTGDHWQPSFHP